jgi:hypothetical protein
VAGSEGAPGGETYATIRALTYDYGVQYKPYVYSTAASAYEGRLLYDPLLNLSAS